MVSLKFLLLTFLLQVTLLLGDNDESIVDMVEDILQQVHLFLNVSDVYGRVEQLPDNVESIMEMFASFGELFVNGTLGRCRRVRVPQPDELCTIILDGTGSNVLKRRVVRVLEALSRSEGESEFAQVIPDWKNYEYSYKIITNAKFMFDTTWNCYDYFKKDVIGAILYARDKELTFLSSWCKGWVAENPAKWERYGAFGDRHVWNDMAINRALREIGPNCSSYDKEREFYDKYADTHGLIGGDSNRCLQNIVVRSNQYDEEAFKAFLVEMHKYLFQDLSLYGMWRSLKRANETERARRKAWVRQNIALLAEDLLAARKIFKEAFTDVETLLTDILTKNAKHLDQLLWKERPSRYKAIIDQIVNVTQEKYSRFVDQGGSIEGVMYLPYSVNDIGLHCILNWTDDEPKSSFYATNDFKGAHYVIKWTERPAAPEVLKARLDVVRSNQEIVWNAVFKDATDDLCEQVKKAMSGMQMSSKSVIVGLSDDPESSGFTAVVAVRCSYDFVWYELGWRYYAVAATTSEYALSRYVGEYDSACGQMIFLP